MAVTTKSKLPSLNENWDWDLKDENRVIARRKDLTITVTMPKVWVMDGYTWATPNITWSSGGFETITSTEEFATQLLSAMILARELEREFCS